MTCKNIKSKLQKKNKYTFKINVNIYTYHRERRNMGY